MSEASWTTNKHDYAYYARRLDQAHAAIAATSCDAAKQAHMQLAAGYAKLLAVREDVRSLAA